ncbi:hypothetical protein ACH9L7_18215 (plasmid) [Haloferax sp. S1W]|uniref:hypothetical protein n=1 Tax=Haloferax sp. S1W TaxID=3377110 RepID=UPI0037C8C4C7
MVPPWAPTGPGDNDGRSGPSLDDRPGLGGVSETHRREAIVSFVDECPDRPYTIGELTVALSEWFQDETEGMVPTNEEIHSVLYNFDLPRLEAANRLSFDRETGRIFSSQSSETVVSDHTDSTPNRATTHREKSSGRARNARTVDLDLQNVNVPAGRIVELVVLLFGVAAVAIAVSTTDLFGVRAALVPAGLVVLFFVYWGYTRR